MMSFQLLCKDFGYKEVVEYLNGNINKNDMIDIIKMETRRYAKRQLTWFRKNKETIWLNGLDDINKNIEVICSNL